jgi:hypothetical protein
MRWHHAGMAMLLLMVVTGCPSEFGKEGRVNKAVHKDMLELSRHHCDDKEYDWYCGGYKKDTQRCRDHCGE